MSNMIFESRMVTVGDTDVTKGVRLGLAAPVSGSPPLVVTTGVNRSFTSSLINEPVEVSQALIQSMDALNNTFTAMRQNVME